MSFPPMLFHFTQSKHQGRAVVLSDLFQLTEKQSYCSYVSAIKVTQMDPNENKRGQFFQLFLIKPKPRNKLQIIFSFGN